MPRLRLPIVPLGLWPTPIAPVAVPGGGTLWFKCEGDSHPLYGGNKLRTLEVWLGHALERGANKIWAIGAYGSNHAVATVLHAKRAGLAAGAVLFPQPTSEWAIENCAALVASGCDLIRLRSVVQVPFVRVPRGELLMPPGGATTIGTFGALAAAFEVAEQIEARLLPLPTRIVLAVGSTCTTAGLLAGLHLARAVGAWRWPLPIVHGVRVTPWPVTSRLRIAVLAAQTLDRVGALGGQHPAIPLRALLAGLVIDGRELGPGYGKPTATSTEALTTLAHGPRLDGVYSAKAAAAALRLHRASVGPILFWSSKSTARLPLPDDLRAAPRALFDWMTSDPAALTSASQQAPARSR